MAKTVVVLTSSDNSLTLDGDSRFTYSLSRVGRKEVLTIDSAKVNATLDGRVIMAATMDHDSFVNSVSDIRVRRGDKSSLLKKLDTFGVPIVEFMVDDSGREVSREVLQTANNDFLISTGDYLHARLFHAPFEADAPKWTAPIKFSLGGGAIVDGALKYEAQTTKGDVTTVKCNGILKGESVFRVQMQRV